MCEKTMVLKGDDDQAYLPSSPTNQVGERGAKKTWIKLFIRAITFIVIHCWMFK